MFCHPLLRYSLFGLAVIDFLPVMMNASPLTYLGSNCDDTCEFQKHVSDKLDITLCIINFGQLVHPTLSHKYYFLFDYLSGIIRKNTFYSIQLLVGLGLSMPRRRYLSEGDTSSKDPPS